MKKVLLVALMAGLASKSVDAQINRSEVIKKKTNSASSIYSLTSARISIKTGNDNKEAPSGFLLYLLENNGIWGEGKELFAQQDQSGKGELKRNSTTEIPLQKFSKTSADIFTLTNLQNKGLRFVIYYYPNFFADAWKIDAVTITLEFKDQYGNVHSTMGTKVVQFNTPNGLLTNTKGKMIGTTDGFFSPQPITVTN